MRAALDAHYAAHPSARPSLSEVAQITAEIDGNSLAHRPDLILRAAQEIVLVNSRATPDDVLRYAEELAATL